MTVAALRAHFASGATRSADWRDRQLHGLARMLDERARDFTAALHADLGKSEAESTITDIALTRGEIAAARTHLQRWMEDERVPTPIAALGGRSWIARQPLGVVLVIGTWNYPVQLSMIPLVSALAAGNCVVLKPSEISAHTSATLAKWMPHYVDPRAVQVIEGGADTTTALLAERFDHIFFTGNSSVAKVILRAAAEHLTPVTLELGGKSPCIVDRRAHVPVAARRIALGKFLNAGQTCIAPDYVLVHERRHDELVRELTAAIGEFYGDDPRTSADYARIVSDRHFDRLARLMTSGTIATGGTIDRATRYIAPTVLTDVDPAAPIMAEEIFGPLLPVLRVTSLPEAIDFVNGRPEPLSLYVFTTDTAAATTVTQSTKAGGTCVNATLLQHVNRNLPFGGVGASGTGAYHGRYGFEVFSHRRGIVSMPARLDLPIAYPPYTGWKRRLLEALL